ncbi:molybdopterin-synthase adenylyltransferase MoeB [Erwinia sp. OLTSP20]|uniref:molybdopterin-synthase adenylyltransferase MoeB n=1 Tax=unclassified Erwinia TaxID=2622719 RepID=UPI000C19DF8B|nr:MULTISPECIES: molybdopterin-synthase adenylyltransferase MoeB [unclassified Erwinia]PIJ48673.1 molybdopterin-synthase adenylyltransferase MoeB [Erwinia sp. OAMSP11]PIJ69297.1 molybdopterin-synthase adenylyltransferase MoeB [Erwinia sp. OLSSP12]PIJ79131.1 molybdopterin-synthase adenylyltransferase MoeB [Erwinia sp. OLCASP19]PIJ80657.1 molybdopterin-synthase adenylyltransferase MoeB [Erwinia sp. OLMTSP26]PIJ82808.1 molybdopterin-synthase adenylyltransferase MoeB [Erwinia sp. OLMDSP33]
MAERLSDDEMLRYNRQIMLRGFDFDGQEALKAARVLIVGLGGLGCAAAQYLAGAGIGTLTLLDFDRVSLSNLQRQVLHSQATIGEAKVISARRRLTELNPLIAVDAIDAHYDDQQLTQLLQRQHLVLDCSDNLSTREQLNRLCYERRLPLVSAAAIRMEGQISVFSGQPDAPCYRCISRLFGEQTLSCAETGVMAPLVGVIGSLQAMEAIRLLTGYGKAVSGTLLLYDAMTLQFRQMTLQKDPHCEVCGQA